MAEAASVAARRSGLDEVRLGARRLSAATLADGPDAQPRWYLGGRELGAATRSPSARGV
jgi:hypothetical protein